MTVGSVYLAARFGRQSEMRQRRLDLLEVGVAVTSHWLDEDPSGANEFDLTEEERQSIARLDLGDVARADALVLFTEERTPDRNSAGIGRHIETGYALARGKPVFVVGPTETVFHSHPRVRVFSTWPTLIDELRTP